MNLRAKDKRGDCGATQHSTMTRKSLQSLIIERTLTHTVTPVTGTRETNKIPLVPFLAELKRKLFEVKESCASFPLPSPTSKDITFKSNPRSCWPGSNVSPRIRQQPVGGAGRWSGGATDQYAAQAGRQTNPAGA